MKQAFYGLHQEPRAWYDRFSLYIVSLAFFCGMADTSFFINHHSQCIIFLSSYADGIILTDSNPHVLTKLLTLLGCAFAMKDLGPLHFFSLVWRSNHLMAACLLIKLNMPQIYYIVLR